MRRVVILGIMSLVCVGLTTLYTSRRADANGTETIKPFTAILHEVRFRSNGEAAYEEDYTVAFRSDGSSVNDYHRKLPTGQTVEVKVVEDFGRTQRVAVDYATESTSTYPLPSNYSAMTAKQASACNGAAGVSSNQPPILGFKVVLLHESHTYGNGKSNMHDRWEAPALNCFALRRVDFASRKAGEKPPHNEVVATKIVLGEPDPVLFSIPTNFVERSPSERHAEFEHRFGMRAPTPPDADEVYTSARQRSR